MSIKKQIVVATFEVEVQLTDNGYGKGKERLLVRDNEDDHWGNPSYSEEFNWDDLSEAMFKTKLDTGEYRLEIKVISVQ